MEETSQSNFCTNVPYYAVIGKPYLGKPNVRFDEGEVEIDP